MFVLHRNKGVIVNQFFSYASHISILYLPTLQVHRYEVQGRHVHRFVFPKLLLRRCLLSGIPFQKLHLCGLLLLQHRCVFEQGTAFYSIWRSWLAEGTHNSLIYGSFSTRSSGIRPGFSMFDHLWLCFMPLNYSLTSLPPHRLPFWTLASCQQWNWARLWLHVVF